MPAPGHLRQLPPGPPGPDTVIQETWLPKVHTTKLLAFDAIREDGAKARSARHQWCRGHDAIR